MISMGHQRYSSMPGKHAGADTAAYRKQETVGALVSFDTINTLHFESVFRKRGCARALYHYQDPWPGLEFSPQCIYLGKFNSAPI